MGRFEQQKTPFGERYSIVWITVRYLESYGDDYLTTTQNVESFLRTKTIIYTIHNLRPEHVEEQCFDGERHVHSSHYWAAVLGLS